MKKVVLVDGNNLLFRSYYATAYSGNFMRNADGFPTNGLYGFVNMLNKIINEENPEYMVVAFDIGKTFRHEKYSEYKGGRDDTPNDLKVQFPYAKKILSAMGIMYLEKEGYEADDIIGTIAKEVDINDYFVGLIVSSDKDLLQLISNDVEVKLLKTKDYIRMNRDVFFETYGIEPIRMIDLKGLMGDSSDNIPGVKGIGEKTALKLLQEYDTIENLYDNIDKLKGATKVKLESGKKSAFDSKEIATIYRDVPLDIKLEDTKYVKKESPELIEIYNYLGFYSFLKKIDLPKKDNKKIEVNIINDISEIKIDKPVAVYLDIDNDNYHNANIIGMGVYNEEVSIYIPYDVLKNNPKFLTDVDKYTYDIKKLYVSLIEHNIKVDKLVFDTMISAYILNYNLKDDIAYLANELEYDIPFTDKKDAYDIELELNIIAERSIMKAKFIYETRDKFISDMEREDVTFLYNEIELPLTMTLGNMEIEGIRVDKNILLDMKEDIRTKLDSLTENIYNLAGCEFNISSPKQLGEVLFEKLNLPYGKKKKTGYSTDVSVLNKLKGDYPIVDLILEHRSLSKLNSTYVEGILNSVSDDGKIHTIYTQALTRTGRLSSIEPNLQNIPVRNEYGRLIRKAFIPEENSKIMSSDYSQIELRIFAHLSKNEKLIEAFNNNMDIHTKTAMDIFHVPMEEVTKDMRRHAKAVNFGILYGISSFGLAEDLGIPVSEAKRFMDKYFEVYPGIKDFMNKLIEEATTKGYAVTLMNRKRVIEELTNSNYIIKSMGQRMALNTPIQGSSADILKKAMVEIERAFKKLNLKSKMLLQVHDELIFNVLTDEKETVTNVVTNIMENTYKISVPLVVDVNFGTNWYEAK